jgi:3-hydroxyisobutyrate dehydrogenase-like beta-hydroxyacid dehydrogenase
VTRISIENCKVGFIGLGALGAPIVEKLLEQRVAVFIFDIDASKATTLRSKHANVAKSVREIGDSCDVVFMCLPTAEVSLATAAGPEGLASGAAVTHVIELSTVGSKTVTAMAEYLRSAGKWMLDCPLSGGPRGVRSGSLTAMISGRSEDVAYVHPLIELFAKNIFKVGTAVGLGQTMKLVNNMISAAGMLAACEGIALATRKGIDPSVCVSVLNASTGRNSATEDKFPKSILPRTFDYGGRFAIMTKDVGLCRTEGESIHVPMMVTSFVHEFWQLGIAKGMRDQDYTCIMKIFEEWMDVVVKGQADVEPAPPPPKPPRRP